jgi:hypothetical protein
MPTCWVRRESYRRACFNTAPGIDSRRVLRVIPGSLWVALLRLVSSPVSKRLANEGNDPPGHDYGDHRQHWGRNDLSEGRARGVTRSEYGERTSSPRQPKQFKWQSEWVDRPAIAAE